ncbi:2OG-Fe(II) oxygenase [Pacificoceanicola onchidii]|uniref:2OG-Fe(II) oxygenase n=1 Tax=Pacificoceanicola onchidii TaxID=2562685 RepID=UPI0010A68866|nr:2OG-Fe(II) oxygenase [Pacificoceanicola onchidii]
MTLNSLALARDIARPSREAMLRRAPSVQDFWHNNTTLFEDAWKEWEQDADLGGLTLDESLYAPALRDAVKAAWANPAEDTAVRDLWQEVFPGVYKAQFFDPEKLPILRGYMDKVADANIPLRPPYGISLNRAGAMLDPRSEGYLGAPGFQSFYDGLMNRYMRPISRLLFPDVAGYDTQTFGFSIQWKADTDTSLRPHSDASSVTLNINLNLPGEGFSGSGVSFIDPESRRVESLTFDPGTALIHHGSVPHASEPITEGSRSNFVLWLYGRHGQAARGGVPVPDLAPEDRWTLVNEASDGFAPF